MPSVCPALIGKSGMVIGSETWPVAPWRALTVACKVQPALLLVGPVLTEPPSVLPLRV